MTDTNRIPRIETNRDHAENEAIPGSSDSAGPMEKRPRRTVRIAAAAAAVVALACIGALAWWFSGSSDSDGFFDANAKTGQASYKSQEEMQAEANRKVEEGMFNISILSTVEFDDGASPGFACIENVPGNNYNMKVAIALDDTGEILYESGGIAPGSFIETIELSDDLDQGVYEATATFTAFDLENLEEAGKAAAKVSLIVKG